MRLHTLFSSMTLKAKLTAVVSAAAILPVLMAVSFTLSMDSEMEKAVAGEMDTITKANISQIARDAYILCRTTNHLLEDEVRESSRVVKAHIKNLGGLRLGERKVAWDAANGENSAQRARIELPEMLAGGVWLGQNTHKAVTSPVVDDMRQLTGEECTIFQRMNPKGDMLRVASSVVRDDGTRSGVGEYIPAKKLDGTASPLIAEVLKGRSTLGRVFAQGADYLVEYSPLTDASGEVIGMLGVGLAIKEIDNLRRALKETQVGKTGYIFVVGATGRDRGRYMISKDNARDGENVWDERDADGNYFVRDMIEKATAAPAGEPVFARFRWKNSQEEQARGKVAALIAFEPWNWIIGVGMYEDEYLEIKNKFVASLDTFRLSVICGGVFILIVIIPLAVFMGVRLARPIETITDISQKIAAGDLHGAENDFRVFTQSYLRRPVEEIDAADAVPPGSETGRLIFAIRRMTRNLTSLVRQVRESGIQVTASATQIAASAREVEATVTEQAASTSQVNAVSSQISSTAGELVATLKDVGRSVVEAGAMADQGREGLAEMEEAMRRLSDSTSFVSSKLAVISEKANTIGAVVTAINKVADQTNLLSLNAAIEAEKAGEYGRGFSVVAREIRRLADQTAAAALDIEGMVGQMQSAVSAEVMEMDKFAAEVRRGVEEVAAISSRFGEIIAGVQALGPRFAAVDEGMRTQSEGASQISEAMSLLAEAAGQTKESIMEFNQAARRLNEAVHGLQDEVSRFKLEA